VRRQIPESKYADRAAQECAEFSTDPHPGITERDRVDARFFSA